jgi:hypothetical protein
MVDHMITTRWSTANETNLCSGGIRFDSPTGHSQVWLRFLFTFLNPLSKSWDLLLSPLQTTLYNLHFWIKDCRRQSFDAFLKSRSHTVLQLCKGDGDSVENYDTSNTCRFRGHKASLTEDPDIGQAWVPSYTIRPLSPRRKGEICTVDRLQNSFGHSGEGKNHDPCTESNYDLPAHG